MSANTYPTAILRILIVLFATFTLNTSILDAAQQHHAPTPCSSEVPLLPGDTWRDPGTSDGVACFSLDLDATDLRSADVLIVELSLPADAPRAHVTATSAESKSVALLQTATTLVLDATPGRYQIRVAIDDPELPLAPFRLNIDLTSVLTKDENDAELEIEPDPLVACGGPRTKDENDAELEIEPDPLAAPNGTISSNLASATIWLDQLQGIADADDQGDTFLRATSLPVGQSIEGAITNNWGDDDDVIRFDVTTVGPVGIQLESASTLGFELFDAHGQRLDWVTGVDEIRLVRALVPGRYFVRISGGDVGVATYTLGLSPRNRREVRQVAR